MRQLLRSVLLLSLVACAAHAAPVHWQLNDVVFSDGGMVFGGFDFDAGTGTYSNIDLTTTPGSVMTSGSFYTTAASYVNATGPGFFNGVSTVPVFSGTTLTLGLGFSPALTAAGGTVNIVSPAGESVCSNTSCAAFTSQRTIVSGTATAVSTSSPKRWYLRDVILTDGAHAFGSFVYDANTNTYSSISITSTSGSAIVGGASYFNLSPAGGGSVFINTVSAATIVSGTTNFLTAIFGAPLTNAGGTVNIVALTEGICTAANCATTGTLRSQLAGMGAVSTDPLADDIKVLPQIADGGSFITTFVFTNPTGDTITCRLTIWGENGNLLPFSLNGGNPVATYVIVVPAHSSKFLASSGVGPLVVGYAVAEHVAHLGVTAVYRLAGASEATVVGVQATEGFAMPFDETPGYDTGLALGNINGQDTAIEYLYFYDTTGKLIFTDSSHTLGPLRHESFSLGARYGASIMGQRGEVRVYRGVQGTPSGPAVGLTGMGVRVNVNSGIFTSLQTFSIPAQ
ncbi:MAG TPA: hypothetical protein VGR73_03550 [Bryobacteraceae bacterium]|nr:hypothetical protein [Bryobacteraceae bacterium]